MSEREWFCPIGGHMNLDEALNPDLIGALPDGRMTLPKPAFEAVHAAARELNQNAESLNSGGVSSGGVELDRLREALETAQWPADRDAQWHRAQDIIRAAARRFLALTETGQVCVSPNTNADVGGVCGLSVEKHPDTSKWPDDRHEIVPGYVIPADYLTEDSQ